ncbi:MAG: GNAT family N-acetyltransferase, partial [Pseudomonadota bacterium]
MTATFRAARREDVAAIVTLLRDDHLGQHRETADLTAYLEAFEAMAAEPGNCAYVG